MTMVEINRYGMMMVRRTMGGKSIIGQVNADELTLYDALEALFATGHTTEILGYYQNTSSWTRPDIYLDTEEAEERKYP